MSGLGAFLGEDCISMTEFSSINFPVFNEFLKCIYVFLTTFHDVIKYGKAHPFLCFTC